MSTVHAILEAARETHKLPLLRIVETGNKDTAEITRWCSKNSNITFDTADLNGVEQERLHSIFEQEDIAKYCVFHTQDHKKYLSGLSWIDIAFLSPDNLQEGLEEFHLAASAGAYSIIIRDYQTKAALAVKQAKRFGWAVEYSNDYCILIQAGI